MEKETNKTSRSHLIPSRDGRVDALLRLRKPIRLIRLPTTYYKYIYTLADRQAIQTFLASVHGNSSDCQSCTNKEAREMTNNTTENRQRRCWREYKYLCHSMAKRKKEKLSPCLPICQMVRVKRNRLSMFELEGIGTQTGKRRKTGTQRH